MAGRRVQALTASREDVRAFLPSVNGRWQRHSMFRAVRAFYNWLEREGHLPVTPCYRMQAPALPKQVLARPTLEEVQKLLTAAPRARDKAIVAMLTDTGLRLSGLASIKARDIEWRQRTIKVWGKGAKERVVRFGETTAGFLRAHVAAYTPPTGANIWGVTDDGIRLVLRRLRQATGIKCNPHSFRRTFACEQIKGGMNLFYVQSLLGHESLEMTRRYARQVNSEDAIRQYKPVLK